MGVGHNCDDVGIRRRQLGCVHANPSHFDLRKLRVLEPFDEYQVQGGIKLRNELFQCRLWCRTDLRNEGSAAAGAYEHLRRAGFSKRVAVFTWLIDIEVVVCVLDDP